ncbi:MAG TPA: transglycosylase family protein [Thermoleophilaceae bacterium]|nr:transglycosylase family protein [Thermoleophilaceae bacterium]
MTVSVALMAGVGAVAPSAALADDPSASGAATAELTLRKGDRGRAVRSLQRRLGISADGVFGSQTARAVRRYQRRKGLTADGIVGPMTRRAMGLPRFARDSVRSPSSRRGSSGGPGSVPAILQRIAECESGGDPEAVSRDGRYRGKYQFLRSTWRANGGTGDPADASEAAQDRVALRLYRAQGTKPWPVCGRKARS